MPSTGGNAIRGAATDSLTRRQVAWDGEWIRSFYWHGERGDRRQEPTSILLQASGPKGLNAFRPHTVVWHNDRPLSELLTNEYWDVANKHRHVVQYVEDETVHGLRCAKLRLGLLAGGEAEPEFRFVFLWLARDRNYLPVRSQRVDLSWSDQIPSVDEYVDDLREISPGLWFPYHIVELAYDFLGGEGAGTGQVLIQVRQERQVESLSLNPKAPDDLFTPAVTAGTWIYVNGGAGNILGRFRQKEDGVPRIAGDKFAVMAESARGDRRDYAGQQRRKAAQDALVGTPFPGFGDNEWLNGRPQTLPSLAGKVTLIAFWAEWNQASERALNSLSAASRGLAADGVTVITVHSAGSDHADILQFADEARLDCPIYVDRAATGVASRWGRLFEKLGVRDLPHAFVIDRNGKIAAHGGLDQMMAKARAVAGAKQ